MKVSYEWLHELININESAADLAKKFNLSGLEVEGISKTGVGKQNIVACEVINVEKHPKADALVVTTVDAGLLGKRQIITNLTATKKGQKLLVSLEGAKLATGLEIKKSKIKDVESEGMFVGWEDLGFEHKIDGAILLDGSVKNGTNYLDIAKFEDDVIELELTANRGDCLGMTGVAREVSTYFKKNPNKIDYSYKTTSKNAKDVVGVEIKTKNCMRYCGGVILDVKIEPSPLWMQMRLIKAGVRPISNVVDITNYIMLECNQPLHAFDLDKIKGGNVIIRDGKQNELLKTLDDVERKILPDDVIIADFEQGHCIGGVMGGQVSEVSENTKNIFLESAFFNPTSIRKTSKRLGLKSESSYRFERTIDITNVDNNLKRALYLFDKLGVGKVCDGIIDEYSVKYEKTVINITSDWINNKLGSDISEKEIIDILTWLGFEIIKEKDVLKILVPGFRSDVTIKEDISEEVARVYGFNNIKPTIFPSSNAATRTPYQQFQKDLRDMFYRSGCDEAFNLSLVGPFIFDKMKLAEDHKFRKITLMDMPLSDDLQGMRNSLVPGMVRTIAFNVNRQNKSLSLFEVGNVSFPGKNELPDEELFCSVALAGNKTKKDYTNAETKYDFYDIKGIIDAVFEHFNIKGSFAASEEYYLHPFQQAKIMINGIEAGIIGKIHPLVCESLGVDVDAYVCEISCKKMFENSHRNIVYKEVPKFPSSERDLALIVDENVKSTDITEAVKNSGVNILQSVNVFDIYKGTNIESGKYSIAINMSFNKITSTLTDKEVDDAVNKIFSNLSKNFSAKIR